MSSFIFETITARVANFGDNMSYQEVQENLTLKFRHASFLPVNRNKTLCKSNFNSKNFIFKSEKNYKCI